MICTAAERSDLTHRASLHHFRRRHAAGSLRAFDEIPEGNMVLRSTMNTSYVQSREIFEQAADRNKF